MLWRTTIKNGSHGVSRILKTFLKLAATVLYFGTGISMTEPLFSTKKNPIKTFFTFCNLLAIPQKHSFMERFAFFDAHILLELLQYGSKSLINISSLVTKLSKVFSVYSGYNFNNFFAFSTLQSPPSVYFSKI